MYFAVRNGTCSCLSNFIGHCSLSVVINCVGKDAMYATEGRDGDFEGIED